MENKQSQPILFVEDDEKLSELVCRSLRRSGYSVDHAPDAETASGMAAAKTYSLLVTDLMLPGQDGLSLLVSLRSVNPKLPVLILSAKGSVNERIEGLQAGADDYLPKPFAFDELAARIDALLRRSRIETAPEVLEEADLRVDLLAGKVFRGDVEIELQPQEYALLVYLMRNRGRIVTRSMVLHDVWHYNADSLTNVVESRICKLRRKIDTEFRPKLIHTVRGSGYEIRPVD
ncbi:MAG: response regulator transcription factor [Pontiellaceae bacterium]|nr:response regulator transcription factor [Pontiellaceae bacterium]MBN2785492.1 response regulator transcription factor [Pontiellaceae bacterium]